MNPSGSEAKGKATNTQSQEEGEEEERGSLDSFLKWAAGLGVSDSPNPDSCSCLGHSLGVSYFPDAGGRGLGAVRDITRGELLLKVPKSALITTHSLLNDERLSTALKAYPSLSPAQVLTICFLYEMSKGKASPWHPYLLHLPRSYGILAAFGEFEKQALQVDYAIWAAQKALSKAEYEWKEATPLMKELKLKPQFLTFRAWIWATGTISSRTLHIPWDEAGCLCPVGDLFNYAAPGEDLNGFDNVDNLQNGYALDDLDTQHSQRLTDGAFEEDAAAYCFYAKTNYKKGEQVLLSYGTYTNLELLEYYGFLLEDNPNEKVFIPLEPDIHSSSSWPKDSLYIHQNGRPSFALMAALRVWATPPYQRKSIRHRAYSGSQLSQDNEISVMTWIAKKCHATLKAMPTSIEDDNLLLSFTDKIQEFDNLWEWGKVMPAFGGEFCNLLQATNLKRNDESFASRRAKMLIDRWKLAVHWRLIYKKVLVDCISYCTDTINSLSSKNDIIL
ncbi:PREDICTED: protein SET DOMAIN GROUP 40 isoform X1 [Theobroma cacao]|uniref:Protein SET DOMAIN GROUP 40 isoform X1 n=1 Tax=Theobroma cacao TaxID=3641 RepID=A0AB32W562_THECC|nr:PREDICTED: protein SET DOMAIN GROUP 40 isoform X1 [Theobroma cacao]